MSLFSRLTSGAKDFVGPLVNENYYDQQEKAASESTKRPDKFMECEANKLVANNIREIRTKSGLTHEQFSTVIAEQTGRTISPDDLFHMEDNRQEITIPDLNAIAIANKYSINQLFERPS